MAWLGWMPRVWCRTGPRSVQHVTALITGSAISDLPRVWALRKAFIDIVRSAPGARDKFNVYYLVGPLTSVPGGAVHLRAREDVDLR